MNAVADARGLKRACASCGGRFYDLNKRPILCPNCGTEFVSEARLKGRKSRLPVESDTVKEKPVSKPIANDDQDTDVEIRDDGVVSLEDVALEEGDDVEIDGDDDIAGLEEIEDDAELDVPVDSEKE